MKAKLIKKNEPKPAPKPTAQPAPKPARRSGPAVNAREAFAALFEKEASK
jgi:hypothetical protein